ncbi:unnamed protein product [Danaus chrysippus]|uniref:(African queen) hypothetical protein n=1 Tax=Danaus chrysippus TaxID=151541 RepID=A0A8J2VZ53_9NEOP|nr:unnamed protein product [Danaus chrysippus]
MIMKYERINFTVTAHPPPPPPPADPSDPYTSPPSPHSPHGAHRPSGPRHSLNTSRVVHSVRRRLLQSLMKTKTQPAPGRSDRKPCVYRPPVTPPRDILVLSVHSSMKHSPSDPALIP